MSRLSFAMALVTLPLAAMAGGFQYHDVTATFVSADTKSNNFVIRFDDGSTSSGMAEGSAAKMLGSLKAGDKVSVTCKDNDKGEHLSATAIKVLK